MTHLIPKDVLAHPYLTPAQVERMARAFAGPYRARNETGFRLMAQCGLYPRELASLKIGDVQRSEFPLIWRRRRQGTWMTQQVMDSCPIPEAVRRSATAWIDDIHRVSGRVQPGWPFMISRKGFKKAPRALSRQRIWQVCSRTSRAPRGITVNPELLQWTSVINRIHQCRTFQEVLDTVQPHGVDALARTCLLYIDHLERHR